MTIFYAVAIKHVEQRLEHLMKSSREKDNSLVNKALHRVDNMFFKSPTLSRDADLSEQKRLELNHANNEIKSIASSDADEKIYDQLNRILKNCQITAKNISEDKGHKEGHTGYQMSQLRKSLENVYQAFKKSELLNRAYDVNQPLSIFSFYIAQYIAEKTIKEVGHNAIVKEKQKLLLDGLKACKRNMNNHNGEPEVDVVLNQIDNLINTNNDLSHHLHLSTGYCKECLLNARNDLKLFKKRCQEMDVESQDVQCSLSP